MERDSYLGITSLKCLSYLRSERILASEEFHQLPIQIQESFHTETKPNYEILSVSGASNLP